MALSAIGCRINFVKLSTERVWVQYICYKLSLCHSMIKVRSAFCLAKECMSLSLSVCLSVSLSDRANILSISWVKCHMPYAISIHFPSYTLFLSARLFFSKVDNLPRQLAWDHSVSLRVTSCSVSTYIYMYFLFLSSFCCTCLCVYVCVVFFEKTSSLWCSKSLSSFFRLLRKSSAIPFLALLQMALFVLNDHCVCSLL